MVTRNTFYAYNHQNKANAYVEALVKHGFSQHNSLEAHVILMDIDIPARVNRHFKYFEKGSRLFIYPHSARATVAWDGFWQPSQYINTTFVSAPGHVDILRAYGFMGRIHVAGWAYCPMKEFVPNENPKKVLFAPIHPTKNNFLSEIDKKINRASYLRLLHLAQRGEIELTVRYIRGLHNNGIQPGDISDLVEYIEGDLDLSYREIDESDVVVSHQTFAYIALARGKPVIMMGEDTPPRNGGSEETFTYAKSWDKYKDLLMYPIDILNEDDTLGLIKRVALSDGEYKDWRSRHVGKPFDSDYVANTIKSFL